MIDPCVIVGAAITVAGIVPAVPDGVIANVRPPYTDEAIDGAGALGATLSEGTGERIVGWVPCCRLGSLSSPAAAT